MSLTIDDIYDKEFAKAGSGYDRDDVDQFLDEICDEMTSMQERIAMLEAELQKAKAEAAEAVKPVAPPVVEKAPAPVAQTSQTLESILLSAQHLADEAVENAKSRAAGILKEAEDKASQIVDDAQEERNTITQELDGLKKSASEYRKSFMELLDKHKSVLEEGKSFFDREQ